MMQVRSMLCAALLLGSAAAAQAQQAPAAAATTKVSRYLPGATLNYAALLPAPPAVGSAAGLADLAAVHRAEEERTPAQVKDAQRDDQEESMFAFATVLGPRFDAADLPLTAALSLHLREESSVVNPSLKAAFKRPRPFVEDKTVHPVCEQATTNSYPSGHSMVGYLEGFALAQMVLEQKTAILARAREYAQNRIVCGVHNPTDIEASHTIALALFGALSTSQKFQAELEAARAELRKRLALP